MSSSEDTGPDQSTPEDDVPMGFFEHLEELRSRLIRALLGFLPAVGVGWAIKEKLLVLLVQPLVRSWEKNRFGAPSLHFANPVDPFVAYMKIALIFGLIVASPWVFWQLWAFVSPGLYRKEKRVAVPFVLASTALFVGGAYFGYQVAFPMAFVGLLEFAGKVPGGTITIQPTLMISEYLGFSTQMLLAFGVVFEVPVVITFLALAGIVDWRQLLRFGRWWIVLSSILGAILTPPDVTSQMIMMIPLIGLYFVSVGIAFLIGKRKPKTERESE